MNNRTTKRGRPAKGIERMLRMCLLQVWFNLSDEGIEDGLYDSIAMRRFAGIADGDEDVPDATTLLKFRHLLEEHELNKAIFEEVNRKLKETGHMLRGGTIVDATIIQVPSSTKKRDSEMLSTKRNKQYYFGMKCHISGLVHTLKTTPANAADVKVAAELLRDDDRFMYWDNGYQGIAKRPEIQADVILALRYHFPGEIVLISSGFPSLGDLFSGSLSLQNLHLSSAVPDDRRY